MFRVISLVFYENLMKQTLAYTVTISVKKYFMRKSKPVPCTLLLCANLTVLPCHLSQMWLRVFPPGVIGDVTSDSTAAMARLLGKHKVAQISFSASAPSLRNKEKYPFLLRTVRPAIDEARVHFSLQPAS